MPKDQPSRYLALGRQRVINEKGRKLSRLISKIGTRLGQLTAQYDAGPRTRVSGPTTQSTLSNMGHFPLVDLC
ncbi:hypothetical protein TNCV_2740211 [Trichonephila clavipes]|nr:hypothetical protein TNCV_2740211 [Trichonephila clavipes]